MGEKSRNHSHVSDLALEVVQGVADRKALADFRTLAEANGYEGRPGGWVYAVAENGGTTVIAHGWARFAQLVVNGTVRLRTVREIEAASNTVPVKAIDAGTAIIERFHTASRAQVNAWITRHDNEAWSMTPLAVLAAVEADHVEAIAEDAGYVSSMHVTTQGVRRLAEAVERIRNRDALRKALRVNVPPSEQPFDVFSLAAAVEQTRQRAEASGTAPWGADGLTPSERAYRAGYAHPVVIGQPCGASSFYTKVEHGGLLAAYRSSTSGARWVLCTEHARPTALTHDANVRVYPVDTEYEHGLALSMDGIKTAAAAERAKRKARCDACSTLRLVDDLDRVRIVGGAGSSETESYCRGECPRVVDVEQARALALVIEEQRAAAAPPAPDTAEYELDKLRGAFTLACRSRDLWRERAKAAGVEAVDDDPARDDDSNELLDRIVRRAQYTALVAMLAVVDGWVEGAQENHEALQHRGESIGSECWTQFHPDDIRNMINDAAREVGTADPYRG